MRAAVGVRSLSPRRPSLVVGPRCRAAGGVDVGPKRSAQPRTATGYAEEELAGRGAGGAVVTRAGLRTGLWSLPRADTGGRLAGADEAGPGLLKDAAVQLVRSCLRGRRGDHTNPADRNVKRRLAEQDQRDRDQCAVNHRLEASSQGGVVLLKRSTAR